MSVRIFTTSVCQYCVKAKEYFKERGVKYEEINVEGNDEAMQESLKLTGGEPGVPVIDINGTIIHGWDKNAIDKALDKT